MLKTYQFKTHCKGDSHSSKTANIILPGLVIKQRWTTLRVQAKAYLNSSALMWVETTHLTWPDHDQLCSIHWLLLLASVYTEHEVSIFNRSHDIVGSKISKLVTWPKTCPFGGNFFLPQKPWKVNLSTKCELHSYIRSEVIVGFRICKLGHFTMTRPTLGVICHAVARTFEFKMFTKH